MNEKKYLKINASEVSGCIGSNMYLSKDIIALKIWKRIDNESFEKAIERNNIKIINIKDIKNKDNVNKKYIKKYEEKINNTENGLNNESKIIELYQSIKKVTIKDNNNKSYVLFINKNYEKLLYYTPRIVGYIDGIVENGNDKYIVEIKNRQYKIFDKIPDYEITQIIIYMKMTNIYKCHHIEKYKEKLKTEVIYFDDKIWNTIENKIVDFVDYFEKIYFNIIFQDLFLKKISQDIKIKNELSSNMGIILESNI
jgi:hypothetical protein